MSQSQEHKGFLYAGYDYASKEEGIWMSCLCGFQTFSKDDIDVDEVIRQWNEHKEK